MATDQNSRVFNRRTHAATRRGLFGGATGLAALLAGPVAVSASGGEIASLFRRRDYCLAMANRPGIEDAVIDFWSNQIADVEKRIWAAPCTTREAAVAKLRLHEDWMREYWMDHEAGDRVADIIAYLRRHH